MDAESIYGSPGLCQPWWSKFPLLREGMADLPGGNAAGSLIRSAERAPKAPAYRYAGRACSYAKLLRRSLRFASGLRSIGIRRGDRVAIYLPTAPAAIVAYFGVLLAGAVAVPLHEDCRPEEARRRTAMTESAAIVTRRSLVRELNSFHKDAGVRKIIVIEETRGNRNRGDSARAIWLSLRKIILRKENVLINGRDWMRRGSAAGPAVAIVGEDQAVIQYSNGTTGEARGAILTHGAVSAGAAQLAFWYTGVNAEEEVRSLTAPLLHPAGLAVLNATVYQAKCLELNPAYDRSKRPAGKYWLAEASSLALALPPRAKANEGALGYPLPHTEAKVVGEGGLDELPPGTVGELAVKGPQMSIGYWGGPTWSSDGWIRTGDMVKKDADGCFYWADRKEHRFATEQGIIMPNEVEAILHSHPAVSKACVIGVRGNNGGLSAKAYVVLQRGRKVSAVQLNRWCRNRVGQKGLPVRYEFVQELPSTLWGEALKRDLMPAEGMGS